MRASQRIASIISVFRAGCLSRMLRMVRFPEWVRLTFFRSAARGLHVPATLTAELAKHKARKRRANERPRVGCCEELARGGYSRHEAAHDLPPTDGITN